jgi:UDP-N-acetylmuramyl-tripeptide synthetase
VDKLNVKPKNTGDILKLLNEYDLVSDYNHNADIPNIKIEYISYNSKQISDNTLFFCKGQQFKVEYLMDAVKNGVVLYISEIVYTALDSSIAYIKVKDIKKAMAVISNYFYENENRNFKLIGITGTKGKTTTTNFLVNIFNEYSNKKTAYLSTMHIYTKTTDEESHLTTPESVDLHRFFYEARENDLKFLTMEVASQGYKVDRVYGVNFDVGVFLNISEDHISPIEHPSFDDYLNCKLKLLENSKIVVINKDTDFYDVVINSTKNCDKVITFGSNNTADYYVTDVYKQDSGYTFTVKSDKNNYSHEFNMKMNGRFNVDNAIAAITVAKALNIDDTSISEGIKKTEILGRMTVISKDKLTIIVDYAHNKVSFKKLFETIKSEYPNQKVISVFGCVGNKAYNRRSELGSLAGQNSNKVYITADDPQYEKVEDISKDVATYVAEYKTPYEIIEDRETAIKKAISYAKDLDEKCVIVIAGKGAEDVQKVNGKFEKYKSDVVVAKENI